MNPQSPYGPQSVQPQGMPPQGPQQFPAGPPGQYSQMGLPASRQKTQRPWLLIGPLIASVILLLTVSGVLVWALGERQDYKDNSDQKSAAAVEAATKATEEKKETEFLEREKSPFRVYKGPSTFGSAEITYPKTWSAHVIENASGTTPISGFFHPNFVPGERSGAAYALRLEVVEQSYDQVLKTYESNARRGVVRINPYKPPKVPSALGSRIDGEIQRGLNGSTILLPLRDKTIKLSVQSQDFMKDFNDIILANFVFAP